MSMRPVTSVKGPWQNNPSPCARPGCGHPRDSVRHDPPIPGAVLYFGHRLDRCVDCSTSMIPDRSCPGYRTRAQQEAWESLTRQYESTSIRGTLHTAIRRLLELYS